MSKPLILYLKKNTYEETVLFEGEAKEPILEDSITNYEFIDVVFNDYRGKNSQRIYNPSVNMEFTHIAGSYDGWIYIRICQYILLDRQIKLNNSPNVTLQGENGTTLRFSTDSIRNISKVIGYKKGA